MKTKTKKKKKNTKVELPEIAHRVLSFVVERENEYNLFSSYELLERSCGSEAGEGLDYLLEQKLVDFDEQYNVFYATTTGERVVA
jgi:hypothetical protein